MIHSADLQNEFDETDSRMHDDADMNAIGEEFWIVRAACYSAIIENATAAIACSDDHEAYQGQMAAIVAVAAACSDRIETIDGLMQD